MKKTLLALLLAATLLLTACGTTTADGDTADGVTHIDTLNIAFAPYDAAGAILEATEPMEALL